MLIILKWKITMKPSDMRDMHAMYEINYHTVAVIIKSHMTNQSHSIKQMKKINKRIHNFFLQKTMFWNIIVNVYVPYT